MRETPAFRDLERALRRAGVIPEFVDRTIAELRDHYLDLTEEAACAGLDADAARAYATRVLGDELDIADVARHNDALLHWSRRYPLAAACGRSVVYAVAMPFVPVVYCAQRRECLARWGVSFGLASVLTASLLLALYSLFPY